MKTTVVIPTYNEKENITATIAALFAACASDVSALVVDDASPDGTGRIADNLALRFAGRLTVLHRAGKRGLGSAYRDGFAAALDAGADVVCEMDADGSHDPAALTLLMRAVDAGADVAIGSRRIAGGSVVGWGAHRHAMSTLAMAFSRALLGFQTRDVTSGFRAYRRAVAQSLLDEGIQSDGYAFQEETLYFCEKSGARIQEIPIVFRDRTMGKSKITVREVPAFLATIIRLLASHGRLRKRTAVTP